MGTSFSISFINFRLSPIINQSFCRDNSRNLPCRRGLFEEMEERKRQKVTLTIKLLT